MTPVIDILEVLDAAGSKRHVSPFRSDQRNTKVIGIVRELIRPIHAVSSAPTF